MRYFNRLRRHIGRTADEDATEYVCSGCDAGFDRRRQVCPECGSYSIRRREWELLR